MVNTKGNAIMIIFWIGSTGADSVFYYRIHSPVILIEFDHQSPVALQGPRGVPTRSGWT